MDRKAWIAIVLSAIGLIGLQIYIFKHPPAPPPPQAAATPTPEAAPPAASPPAAAATAAVAAAPQPEDLPVMEARSESLYSQDVDYVFSNDKGGIERATLWQHQAEHGFVALNDSKSMPIGAIGTKPGEAFGGFVMHIDREKGEAVFTAKQSDGLEIIKRFTVPSAGEKIGQYQVKMTLEFHNPGPTAISRANYFVSTGGAAPIHPRDLPMYTKFDWMAGKFTTIDVNWFNPGTIPLIGIQTHPARSLYDPETKPDITWAGVASQYFTSIVTAENTKAADVWATRYDTHRQDNTPVYGMEGALVMPGFTVQPGATVTETFTIYTGPKNLTELRRMKGGQDAVLNFGTFGFISEFLLWAMNGLAGLLHSFAAAIIVLTLLIKSALWPVQNRATNEMRKMAALSPKMTEMREKYKDDPQKLNEEMMKMYKEYGVNPLSGCLPMLIQIPIFFGFYAMLGSAIELRNSQFLWIHDLSQPDTIYTLHLLGATIPINLLPIIMAGTMVWQMTISPKSGDAMQQRMMYFMPIVFLAFSYNYASGLALYWTTQNLFSIVQLYLTRNKPLPTLEKKSVAAKREADAAKKKKKRPGQ